VELFVCGPTVYDFSHLGHARTYLAFDALAKYLNQKGYKVFYLQNITDIDDKIINRAKKEKIFWKNLSRKFEKEYLKDLKSLNITSVNKYLKATSSIKEIISQTKRLVKKDFAYQTKDGIYYDISKFKDYGKLSGRTALQAEDAVSRIDQAKGKRNKGDFCLWKLSRKGEPKWKAPFGEGRPGWHIEDTAITEKYFGPQYDIHAGARDLIFPHHEAEIAQMEALSGKKPMAKYWLHTGFLTVKGRKMSKSLANFITIKDFLKNHSARELRLFVLKNHYRSPIDYSEKEIKQVQKQLKRIDEFIGKPPTTNHKLPATDYKNGFEKALEDDFNTPKALAAIFKLISKANKRSLAPSKEILEFLKEADEIFGFIFKTKKEEKIPAKIKNLAAQREKYRQEKKWRKADQIRKKIENLGFQIKDTKEGPEIKKGC